MNWIAKLYKAAELDAFRGKNMPDWIRNNPTFEGKKSVQKVFKRFGLKNFREKVEFAGKKEGNVAYEVAGRVCIELEKELKAGLKSIDMKIRETLLKPLADHSVDDKMIIELREKFASYNTRRASLGHLVEEYGDSMQGVSSTRIMPDGKVKILLQQDASDENGKAVGKVNEAAFRVYEKIKRMIEELGKAFGITVVVSNIDNIPAVKEFHRVNVPLAKAGFEVVFSAENEGAWDLATMSERGLSTCMSWGGDEDACLIGSIASKYVGIIYLTSGTQLEDKGERMIKRCIVRFGVNIKTREPVIIMDRMFDSYDGRVASIFIDAMKKKTPLPILNYAAGFAEGLSKEETPDVPEPKDIRLPTENEWFEGKGKPSYKDTHFFPLTKEVEKEESISNVLHFMTMNLVGGLDIRKSNRLRAGTITAAIVKPTIKKVSEFVKALGMQNATLAKKLMLRELIKQSYKTKENNDMIVEYMKAFEKIDVDEEELRRQDSVSEIYWEQMRAAAEAMLASLKQQ